MSSHLSHIIMHIADHFINSSSQAEQERSEVWALYRQDKDRQTKTFLPSTTTTSSTTTNITTNTAMYPIRTSDTLLTSNFDIYSQSVWDELMKELDLHWDIIQHSLNIHQTSKTDFYKSAQVGGFSPEVEEGERRVRDEINLRLSHPAPTIWEDREIETGLRSVDKMASASVVKTVI